MRVYSHKIQQHNTELSCICSSVPRGSTLAMGTSDGRLSVWKVTSSEWRLLQTIKNIRGRNRPVRNSNYHADLVLLGVA